MNQKSCRWGEPTGKEDAHKNGEHKKRDTRWAKGKEH